MPINLREKKGTECRMIFSKKNLIQFAKVIISILLIAFLIKGIQWNTVANSFKEMEVSLVVMAFVLMAIQFPISASKWQASLDIHGISKSYWYLFKILSIGFFFNNFLPTTIGGDAYRVVKTMPDEGYKSRALSAVLYERVVGFGVLLMFGLIGGLLVLNDNQSELVLWYVGVIGLGIAACLILLILLQTGKLNWLWNKIKEIKKLEILVHNLRLIVHGGKNTAKLVVISVLFQITAILVIQLLLTAVNVDKTFYDIAFLAGIIGIAAIIPLSINGIGIVEGAFVFAALQLGVEYNSAVIVAFVLRILVVPLSVMCGILYMLSSEKGEIKKLE
jgi:uncharacterized protein (TIRG00374 family)